MQGSITAVTRGRLWARKHLVNFYSKAVHTRDGRRRPLTTRHALVPELDGQQTDRRRVRDLTLAGTSTNHLRKIWDF